MLTLHFLDAEERLRTGAEVRRRLRQAGFRDVTDFYTAFTFRGWVAFA